MICRVEGCGEPAHDQAIACVSHCDVPDCAWRGSKPAADMVNSPPHYRSARTVRIDLDTKSYARIPAGKLEAVHVIEGFDLGWHAGNVVKYMLRAGKKGPDLEDLRKAQNILGRLIALKEGGE